MKIFVIDYSKPSEDPALRYTMVKRYLTILKKQKPHAVIEVRYVEYVHDIEHILHEIQQKAFRLIVLMPQRKSDGEIEQIKSLTNFPSNFNFIHLPKETRGKRGTISS